MEGERAWGEWEWRVKDLVGAPWRAGRVGEREAPWNSRGRGVSGVESEGVVGSGGWESVRGVAIEGARGQK